MGSQVGEHPPSLPVPRCHALHDYLTRSSGTFPARTQVPHDRTGSAMELNDNAQLGQGEGEDLRGSGGGGGGGGGFFGGGGGGGGGIGLPIGGGKIGLIITLIIVVAGVCFGGAYGTNILGGGSGSGNQPADNASLEVKCGTANPNRFQNEDCRNWLYVTSIQAFWTDSMPKYFNMAYTPATTRFFSDSVSTGCGQADTGVGPFYCQADKH